MANITIGGNPITTAGSLPKVGSQAPDFRLTDVKLEDVTLSNFSGKKIILNIFPSIDTSVCQASARHFNKAAQDLDNTMVLCVSKDLPMAHTRFCGAEGLKNVHSLSQFRDTSFSDAYKVDMASGPMTGFMSRAIVVIDANGKVVYTEQVPEIGEEPDYDKALSSLK